jgi:hypothetical protein
MGCSGSSLRFHALTVLFLLSSIFAFEPHGAAQAEKEKQPPVPGPMLSQGMIELDTPDFSLTLVRSSQTVAALKPKNANGFDFTPGDLLVARSQDGFMHLGDITLRLRG